MDIIQDKWAEYYEILDPKERRKILLDLSDPADALDDFRKSLFDKRFDIVSENAPYRDMWLFKCVYLPGIYRKRGILKRPLIKEMKDAYVELFPDHPESMTEDEKTLLYREFKNTAARYLSTCQNDGYGRTMLGLKKSTQEEKRKRACREIWQMSVGLSLTAGMTEQFELWIDALRDALFEVFPDTRSCYEELERENGRLA